MKKTLMVFAMVCFVSVMALTPPGHCGGTASLYERLSRMDAIKVYIADVTQSKGDMKADLEGIKKELVNALKTRMTLNFSIVESESDADIAISCDVVEFFWTDKDPVDIIAGAGPILMDAISKDDYVRLQAVFTVKGRGKLSGKRGDVIWDKKIKATITKKEMAKETSVSLANERIVKVFMRDCFSKGQSR